MKRFLFAFLALFPTVFCGAWSPAGNQIKTKWASEVNPQNVLSEYPRPQMVRSEWLNLNGLWNYAITSADADSFTAEGEILVPFAPESSLSGVGRRVGPENALWYERTFTVPRAWKSRNVLLNFGAVDWKSEIWVNDIKVADHTGGYTPFSIDITRALKKSGKQTLRLKVWDGSDTGYQPRGKQNLEPHGIWYTPVTGIWQTVWIEPVSKAHIESWNSVFDIENNTLTVATKVIENQDCTIKVALKDNGNIVAEAEGAEASLSVPSPKLWSPSNPYLYDLEISLCKDGKTVDQVSGYTALRSISVVRDPSPEGKNNTYYRLAINGRPLFMYGPLDQGWWPDGLYTAPTDEALRYDIERTKAWGFNMIRKHIKVEPARWYYWCDKLGIVVWQDMPCIGDHSRRDYLDPEVKANLSNKWASDSFIGGTDCTVPRQWKDNFYKEWGEIISALKCFQSIVVWIPFNEAWGQFDTPEVVEFTRKQDPSRLINAASGGNFHFVGDIMDVHHYPLPAMNAFESRMVNVIGEYGGIGYPVEGHTWKDGGNWGYGGVKASGKEVLGRYEDMAEILKSFIKTGCAAAVYTQTTDVEVEVNGLMTYDRIPKLDEDRLCSINRSVIRSMNQADTWLIGNVAHRGFWKCEASNFSENSIASLSNAQKEGFWGSECDIHLTADHVIVVNHNDTFIDRTMKIKDHNYTDFKDLKLPNGEGLPTFDEYLDQLSTSDKTTLVIEFKPMEETDIVDATFAALKLHGLYDPDRVAFISFNHDTCLEVAKKAPEFTNQFLASGNNVISPAQLYTEGINGLDYEFHAFYKYPEWVEQAHKLGLSVNAWTVNGEEDMKYLKELGVDQITTNEPLMLREVLGKRELKR